MKTLVAVCALLASSLAFAVPINDPHDIDRNNTVEYTHFTVTDAGLFDITAFRTSGRVDPQMFLFHDDGNLDTADYITEDDDSGRGLNSFIRRIRLGLGTYVVAVSDYELDIDEAVAGFNQDRYFRSGTINVGVDGGAYNRGGSAVLTVPAPNVLALLGIGLVAAGVVSRRRKKA